MGDSLTTQSVNHGLAVVFSGYDKTPVSTALEVYLKRPKIGKRFQDSEFSSSQGEDEKTPSDFSHSFSEQVKDCLFYYHYFVSCYFHSIYF